MEAPAVLFWWAGGWVGGWVGWIEEKEAVRMSYCGLLGGGWAGRRRFEWAAVYYIGWWVGGWVG